MFTNSDIQRIVDYYGSDSSIYRKIIFNEATDSEIASALSRIPRMQIDRSASGSILGYTYADPVYMTPRQPDNIELIVNSVDSNNNPSSYGGSNGGGISGNFPISFGRDSQTGQAYINAGEKSLTDTLKAVADRVSLGVTGVNIGAKLGKAIDQTLYNLNPDFWDANLPTINPDTWPTIAGTNEAGQSFIRALFDIAPNGDVTGYIDERVLAQYYQMLMELGLWNSGDSQVVTIDDTTRETVNPNHDIPLPFEFIDATEILFYRRVGSTLYKLASSDPVPVVLIANSRHLLVMSNTASRMTYYEYSSSDGGATWSPAGNHSTSYSATYNNKTVYYDWLAFSSYTLVTPVPSVQITSSANRDSQVAWITRYGDVTSPGGGIDGFTDIDGATQYPPTNITGETLPQTLSQLKQQYPDLFTNPITETVLQPDGATQTITYIPIPWQISQPDDKTQNEPITQPNPTQNVIIDPTIAPDIVINIEPNDLSDPQTEPQPEIPQPPTPDTPNTGSGDAPTTILPTGNATSLWAIYNPTQAQLNAFGGWLWSSNFVEQLKKLFNDPMQAIIGVHKVFATPETGSTQTIVCGYLDSEVPSKIVTSQYTTVNCGSVSLWEYFGNVFDYSPFTSIKIYLPFIGIVPLDVSYIMRSTISVEYKIDVLTGACLANINVSRDGGGGILFSYGGSCICTYPISSGSYTGVVSGALSLAAGLAGSFASGGAALPAVMGVLSGIGRMKTDVQHSGQFSGAAGAMGSKIPYLIIERPQTKVAENIEYFNGIPSNQYMKIKECSNYIKVEKVHLIIDTAYYEEITEIEELLINGVLIN